MSALGLLFVAAACTADPIAKAPVVLAERTTVARPTPSPAAKDRDVVVRAVGDVNLDPNKVSGLARRGYAHAWSGLNGLFETDDLTIVNMECPVARGGVRRNKRYTFLCPPAGVPDMRAAGVDVATLANNHSIDFGVPAMLESVETLRGAGIATVGAGATTADAYRPAFFQRGGRRIAVVGISQIVPHPSWVATEDRPGIASGYDVKAVTAAVRHAAREADYVVVTVHWGIERQTKPSKAQIALARLVIDAGADAVFGHHPHVLQPLAFYKGRPIFYSLGNFVWSMTSKASVRTGVAEVRFGDRIEARLLPARIESSGHPVLR